jgi:hypothetical protein
MENASIAALLTLAVAFAAWGGWRLGAMKRASYFGAGICLMLMAGAYVAHHPALLPAWAIGSIAFFLYTTWYAPFAVALFYLGASNAAQRLPAERKTRANAMRTQAFLLLLSITILSAAVFSTWTSSRDVVADIIQANPEAAERTAWPNGVVRQSIGYTCGAAACATLLRRLKIDPPATEPEMAVLCGTRRFDGTSTLGMAMGIKARAAPLGWRVRIMEPDWQEFVRLRKPLACSMSINGSPHAVVALTVDPVKGVEIADPLGLLLWVPEDEFKREFSNEAVVVFRHDVFEGN